MGTFFNRNSYLAWVSPPGALCPVLDSQDKRHGCTEESPMESVKMKGLICGYYQAFHSPARHVILSTLLATLMFLCFGALSNFL